MAVSTLEWLYHKILNWIEPLFQLISIFLLPEQFSREKVTSSTSTDRKGHNGMSPQPIKNRLQRVVITNNIQLIIDPSKPLKKETSLDSTRDRSEVGGPPLLILLAWAGAEKKHVMKYAHIYLDQGFHILLIFPTLLGGLFPTLNGAKKEGNDILNFLMENPQYESKLIHGFCLGGFIWSQVLLQFEENPAKYENLMGSFVGQIWDSTLHIGGVDLGIEDAFLPDRPFLKALLESYTRFHMKTFTNLSTRHYVEAQRVFDATMVTCPSLHFCSVDDPISPYSSVKRYTDMWTQNGVQVQIKWWEKSQHILHFHNYPEEYKMELKLFLEKIGLLENPQLLK